MGKLGQGSLRAFARQGVHEIASVLPAFKDSVQIREEPGMFGNPSASEIARQTGTDWHQQREQEHQQQPDFEP